MEFIKLDGKNVKSDAERIRNIFNSGKKEMVYVLTASEFKLYAYIDALKENGIDDEIMFELKICYERRNLKLTFIRGNSAFEKKISSITELLEKLNGVPSSIIVEDNDRGTLAEVAQQLVYIGYPLTSVNIMLRREAKDMQKTKRFMANIDEIAVSIDTAITNIDNLWNQWENSHILSEEKQTFLDIVSKARQNCSTIKEKVERAKSVEMSIAVAAIKKTGKSVIVNSMIKGEIAPTSLTLATPNNCIYRKSPDAEYHLTYNGKRTNYLTAKEIYDIIGKEFKKAQDDTQNALCIPDMEIEYVTDGNNFDTFTVYDTPGPGLAGADHGEAAYKAMAICDVAVFAIDYTKFLTEDEVHFLKDVKNQFNQNQKFASLIFAVNKMDLRFDDANSVKSTVYAVDLIRTKLINIDDMYKDCIIFATSALQYYNTIDCEKHCEDFARSSNLVDNIRSLIRNQSKGVIQGEMTKLKHIIDNYELLIGKDKITSDDLKRYSGMPDLLNYAAYICQSKARDEIVNNITVTIDLHQKALKAICDHIENIDKLIAHDEEQIKEVKEIIEKYYNFVKNILHEKIYKSEVLPINSEFVSIRHYMGKEESVDFNELEKGMRSIILDRYKKQMDVYNRIFDFIEYNTFKSINSYLDKYVREGVIEELEINAIMEKVYSSKTIEGYVKSFVETALRENDKENRGGIERLGNEITCLIKKRMSIIQLASEECSEKLNKLNISLAIPEIPDFEFDLPEYTVGSLDFTNIHVNIDDRDIRRLFVGEKLGGFSQFWRNLRSFKFQHKHYKFEKMKYEDYRKEFRKLKADIEDTLDKVIDRDGKYVSVYDILLDKNERLADIFKESMKEIWTDFSKFLSILRGSVENFSSLVDDTEKHRKNIEIHNQQKKFIMELDNCSRDFTLIWDSILKCIDTEEANR